MLRYYATPLIILLAGLCVTASVRAQSPPVTVSVTVLDNTGLPLPGFAVSLTPAEGAAPVTDTPHAVMDQINRQFAPHFLIVRKDTQVRFPNSDSIKHQVYSFSAAKRFALLLDKDSEADPLTFDTPGVVELGCNVHDWMLGYIYVVDTPYFSASDDKGQSEFVVPPGSYTLSIYHPRMQEPQEILRRELTLTKNQTLRLPLTRALLPDFSQYNADDEFGQYE
ncbi:methylamine utilization protein [Alteromonas sp. C1M14]|uniref:methylamine utilization protein n=1 Tax=Alteromonas sp. C1M14 TaxID=2841567 RepID=UPI001C08A1F8|nr:methylamine utilization protein [Alteromonas sp. C1M14]MBU2977281.1 methylamine utilization protein [Alteromonas sp. C1M14]